MKKYVIAMIIVGLLICAAVVTVTYAQDRQNAEGRQRNPGQQRDGAQRGDRGNRGNRNFMLKRLNTIRHYQTGLLNSKYQKGLRS